LTPIGAEPFRQEFGDDIGGRADAGQEDHNVAPGREAPGLGGVNDQRYLYDQKEGANRHERVSGFASSLGSERRAQPALFYATETINAT